MHALYNKLPHTLHDTNNHTTAVAAIPRDMRYNAMGHLDTNSSAYKQFHDQLECVLDLDQLSAQRRKGRVFRGFQEGDISFPPTYKYDKRSNQFDTSTKGRCPAWTDRILFTSKNNNQDIVDENVNTSSSWGLRLKEYFSVDIRSSDHRPVVAQFDCSL